MKRRPRRDQDNHRDPSDSRVLTISSDLPTVLQVLNEVVPNLEEVSVRVLILLLLSFYFFYFWNFFTFLLFLRSYVAQLCAL